MVATHFFTVYFVGGGKNCHLSGFNLLFIFASRKEELDPGQVQAMLFLTNLCHLITVQYHSINT